MPHPFDSFWDRSYRDGSYLDHWEAPEVPPELVALVQDTPPMGPPMDQTPGIVPEDGPVLDVGCGSGQEAVWLALRGFDVVGVDSSREALERARQRAADAGTSVDWRLGSVYQLPVDDASVALVLDRGCLHGIDREDREDYAREIDRVLRPGGRFLLRGARDDDDERGLVGIGGIGGVGGVGAGELDRLFPPPRFTRGPVVPITLRARAGDLPAVMVLLQKQPSPAG